MVKAVIWDFGGVITTSPFAAFNRFEAERGLPRDFIRGVNALNLDNNAWAKFERSEITVEAFDQTFAEEARARGHEVRGADILPLLGGEVRPQMVTALKRCAERLKTGCITNNVRAGAGAGMMCDGMNADAAAEVLAVFDVVIESSRVGLRKPDPRIYQMMCDALSVAPADAVYLDDLGVNCKPAHALGMVAIKVVDPDRALDALENLVGFALR